MFGNEVVDRKVYFMRQWVTCKMTQKLMSLLLLLLFVVVDVFVGVVVFVVVVVSVVVVVVLSRLPSGVSDRWLERICTKRSRMGKQRQRCRGH